MRDEAEKLPRCFESIRRYADEIIVVDTGSTDDTVAIARRHRARVKRFHWCDDFAAARNAALEIARGDWILVIDADEVLEVTSRAAWMDALRSPVAGWLIDIVNSQHCPPSQAIRLIRRDPRVRFERRIHENVGEALERLGLLPVHLRAARLLHDGYTADRLAGRGKLERNFRLACLETDDHPADPMAWLLRGRAAYDHQLSLDEAWAAFAEVDRLLGRGARLPLSAFGEFAKLYAHTLYLSGERDWARELLRRSIAYAPALHNLAKLLEIFESNPATATLGAATPYEWDGATVRPISD